MSKPKQEASTCCDCGIYGRRYYLVVVSPMFKKPLCLLCWEARFKERGIDRRKRR